jgi:eukaryotic-like serine/threonine-protein kinase
LTWLSDAVVAHLRDVAECPVLPTARYEMIEPIGRGGMGTVYRARDRELDRIVAIKVLWTVGEEADVAARMRQEAHILARLEHPGIVPIHEVGALEDGRLFYVMKLVQGPRLDEHSRSGTIADRLRLFTRICEPVAFAHAHGVVHRDLKPENVMVGPFGELLVLDWGAAQTEDRADRTVPDAARTADARTSTSNDSAGQAHATSVVGTCGYMAPEQARGERADGRADVYALGGILHFLLTGGPPDAVPLSGPRPLQAIVTKARSSDPRDRYADVTALGADIERFLAGDPVSALPENVLDHSKRFFRKNRAAVAIVVSYLVVRYLIAWAGT